MALTLRRPAPPLDGLIGSLWDCDLPAAPHRLERVLHQPGAQLIVNLLEDETRTYTDDTERRCIRASGSVLGGPDFASQIIDTREQSRVMGAIFRPGGAHAFTGEVATRLVRDVALEDLFGSAAVRLRGQLLEARTPRERLDRLERWLACRMRGPAIDRRVAAALTRLRKAPDVARIAPLAREVGLSSRRFGQLFLDTVGMSPKRYARLVRFRAVLRRAHAAHTVDWAGLAVAGGFADQAHLAHEFRRLAGLTPTAFLARRGPWPSHLALD